MSEEEKLSTPSFERFTAGISVGSSTYSLPAGQIKGKLEYETHYLEREPERDRNILQLAAVTQYISRDDLLVFARQGAAAVGTQSRGHDAASGAVITVTGMRWPRLPLPTCSW